MRTYFLVSYRTSQSYYLQSLNLLNSILNIVSIMHQIYNPKDIINFFSNSDCCLIYLFLNCALVYNAYFINIKRSSIFEEDFCNNVSDFQFITTIDFYNCVVWRFTIYVFTFSFKMLLPFKKGSKQSIQFSLAFNDLKLYRNLSTLQYLDWFILLSICIKNY